MSASLPNRKEQQGEEPWINVTPKIPPDFLASARFPDWVFPAVDIFIFIVVSKSIFLNTQIVCLMLWLPTATKSQLHPPYQKEG